MHSFSAFVELILAYWRRRQMQQSGRNPAEVQLEGQENALNNIKNDDLREM